MSRMITGSCHCGAVRFEVDTDLEQGTSRCNCSICAKIRFWKAMVPATEFRIKQGAEALTSYRFGSKSIGHLFCSTCGVKTHGTVVLDPEEGELIAVNIACLDLPDLQLDALPVSYQDGHRDNWESEPAHSAYL